MPERKREKGREGKENVSQTGHLLHTPISPSSHDRGFSMDRCDQCHPDELVGRRTSCPTPTKGMELILSGCTLCAIKADLSARRYVCYTPYFVLQKNVVLMITSLNLS